MLLGPKSLTPHVVDWWLKDFAAAWDDDASNAREMAILCGRLDPREEASKNGAGAKLGAAYVAEEGAARRVAECARRAADSTDRASALAAGEALVAAFEGFVSALLERLAASRALDPEGDPPPFSDEMEDAAHHIRFPFSASALADALHPPSHGAPAP